MSVTARMDLESPNVLAEKQVFDHWDVHVASDLGGYVDFEELLRVNKNAAQKLLKCSSLKTDYSAHYQLSRVKTSNYSLLLPKEFPLLYFELYKLAKWEVEFAAQDAVGCKDRESMKVSAQTCKFLASVSETVARQCSHCLPTKKEEFKLVLVTDKTGVEDYFLELLDDVVPPLIVDRAESPKEEEVICAFHDIHSTTLLSAHRVIITKSVSFNYHIEPRWSSIGIPSTRFILASDKWDVHLNSHNLPMFADNMLDEVLDKRVFLKLSLSKPSYKDDSTLKLAQEQFPWRMSIEKLKQLSWDVFKRSLDKEDFLSKIKDTEMISPYFSAAATPSYHLTHDYVHSHKIYLITASQNTQYTTYNVPQVVTAENSFSSLISRKKRKLQDSSISLHTTVDSSISQMLVAGMNTTTISEQDTSSFLENQQTLAPMIAERLFHVPDSPPAPSTRRTIIVNYETMDAAILSLMYKEKSLNIIETLQGEFQSPCHIVINPFECLLLVDISKFFQKAQDNKQLYYIPIVERLILDYDTVHCIITNIKSHSMENTLKCQVVMFGHFANTSEVKMHTSFDSTSTCSAISQIVSSSETFENNIHLDSPFSFDELVLMNMGFNVGVAKHVSHVCPDFKNANHLSKLSAKQLSRFNLALHRQYCF